MSFINIENDSSDEEELLTYLGERKQKPSLKRHYVTGRGGRKFETKNELCINVDEPTSPDVCNISPVVSISSDEDSGTIHSQQQPCTSVESIVHQDDMQNTKIGMTTNYNKCDKNQENNDWDENNVEVCGHKQIGMQKELDLKSDLVEDSQRQFNEIDMLNFSPRKGNASTASNDLDHILEMFNSPSKYNLGKVAFEPEEPTLPHDISSEILTSPEKYGSKNKYVMLSEYDFVKLCALKSVGLPKACTEVEHASRKLFCEKETAKQNKEFDISLPSGGNFHVSSVETLSSPVKHSLPVVSESSSTNYGESVRQTLETNTHAEQDSSKVEIVFVRLFDDKPEIEFKSDCLREDSANCAFNSNDRHTTNTLPLPYQTVVSSRQTPVDLRNIMVTDIGLKSPSFSSVYMATGQDSLPSTSMATCQDSLPQTSTSDDSTTQAEEKLQCSNSVNAVLSPFVVNVPNTTELRKQSEKVKANGCATTSVNQVRSMDNKVETITEIEYEKCKTDDNNVRSCDLNLDLIGNDCEKTETGWHNKLNDMDCKLSGTNPPQVQIRFKRINDKLTRLVNVIEQDSSTELVHPVEDNSETESQADSITLMVSTSGELIQCTDVNNDCLETVHKEDLNQNVDIKTQWKFFKPPTHKKNPSVTPEEADFEIEAESEVEEAVCGDMNGTSESSDGEELTKYFTTKRTNCRRQKNKRRPVKKIKTTKTNIVRTVTTGNRKEEDIESKAVQANFDDDSTDNTAIPHSHISNPYLSKLFERKLKEASPVPVKRPTQNDKKKQNVQTKAKLVHSKVNIQDNKKSGNASVIGKKRDLRKRNSRVLTSRAAHAQATGVGMETESNHSSTTSISNLKQLNSNSKDQNDNEVTNVNSEPIDNDNHPMNETSGSSLLSSDSRSNDDDMTNVNSKAIDNDTHPMNETNDSSLQSSDSRSNDNEVANVNFKAVDNNSNPMKETSDSSLLSNDNEMTNVNSDSSLLSNDNEMTNMKSEPIDNDIHPMNETNDSSLLSSDSRSNDNEMANVNSKPIDNDTHPMKETNDSSLATSDSKSLIREKCKLKRVNIHDDPSNKNAKQTGCNKVIGKSKNTDQTDVKQKSKYRKRNAVSKSVFPQVMNCPVTETHMSGVKEDDGSVLSCIPPEKNNKDTKRKPRLCSNNETKSKVSERKKKVSSKSNGKSRLCNNDGTRKQDNEVESNTKDTGRVRANRTCRSVYGCKENAVAFVANKEGLDSTGPTLPEILGLKSSSPKRKHETEPVGTSYLETKDLRLAKLKAQVEKKRNKVQDDGLCIAVEHCSDISQSHNSAETETTQGKDVRKTEHTSVKDRVNDDKLLKNVGDEIQLEENTIVNGNKRTRKRKQAKSFGKEVGCQKNNKTCKKKRTESKINKNSKETKKSNSSEVKSVKNNVKSQRNSGASERRSLNKNKNIKPSVKILKHLKRRPRTVKRKMTKHRPGLMKAMDISWKDQLSGEAFELEISTNRKPLNVKKMLRNIFESPEAKEKRLKKREEIKEKRRLKKRKEEPHGVSVNGKGKRTSDSEDAWLSDSSCPSAFPAFKFNHHSGQNTGNTSAIRVDCVVSNTSQIRMHRSHPEVIFTQSVSEGTTVEKEVRNIRENLFISPVNSKVSLQQKIPDAMVTKEADKDVNVNSVKPHVSFLESVTKQYHGSSKLLHSPLKGGCRGPSVNQGSELKQSLMKHASQNRAQSVDKSPARLQKTVVGLNEVLDVDRRNYVSSVRKIQLSGSESHV